MRKQAKGGNNLSSLMTRLDHLDKELTPDLGAGGKSSEGEEMLDEFGRMKKACARMAQDVRKNLAERDELLQQGAGGGRKTIELSAKIRRDIQTLKDSAEQLSEMQRREAARLDKKPLHLRKQQQSTVEEVEHKSEVVDLVWRHVEEIELLEKRRYQSSNTKGGGGFAEDRAGLLSHSQARVAALPANASNSSLADIDPEVNEGLQMLQKKDQEIDGDLELLSKGVKRLHAIATDMKEEITVQNMMVDEITTEVDKNIAHLQQLNAKVKDALEKAGGVQRFIVTAILLILILAVFAYAAKMFISG